MKVGLLYCTDSGMNRFVWLFYSLNYSRFVSYFFSNGFGTV
nr:MAG TPA: hypothetical protein [Caudoviricetes sp.]